MRVYNRHRYCERTREYYQRGTFLRMDGFMAVIQLDGRDYISHCVPEDYIVEATKQNLGVIESCKT